MASSSEQSPAVVPSRQDLQIPEVAVLGGKSQGPKTDMVLQTQTNVSQLRISAMHQAFSVYTHLHKLLDGLAAAPPEMWGKTTDEEQKDSGICSWPGIDGCGKLSNSSVKLYGGAAFDRVLHEFDSAARSLKFQELDQHEVANIILAADERGDSNTVAAAEVACQAARTLFGPLVDTTCDRLAFILKSLIDIVMKCDLTKESQFMDDNFRAAIIVSYNKFVDQLSMECKQIARHRLNSTTSPYHKTFIEDNSPSDKVEASNHSELQSSCLKDGTDSDALYKNSARYFTKIRDLLVKEIVSTAFSTGFLTQWRKKLLMPLCVDLFAVSDKKFKDMFAHTQLISQSRQQELQNISPAVGNKRKRIRKNRNEDTNEEMMQSSQSSIVGTEKQQKGKNSKKPEDMAELDHIDLSGVLLQI